MNKNIILGLMIGMIFISFASADLGTYPKGEDISVRGSLDATSVNVSIYYPNSTILVNNQPMVNLAGDIWNYNLTDTEVLGKYVYDYCDENGNNCKENIFRITNSGLEIQEDSKSFLIIAIIFLILIGGLFFIGFVKEEKMQIKWSLFLVGFMFLLAALNIISIVIYDNITSSALISFFDSFTGIMFTVFWICFAFLAVMWFLTLLQAILFKQKIKQAAKFGGIPE